MNNLLQTLYHVSPYVGGAAQMSLLAYMFYLPFRGHTRKQKRELPDTSHLQLTPDGVIKTVKRVKETA